MHKNREIQGNWRGKGYIQYKRFIHGTIEDRPISVSCAQAFWTVAESPVLLEFDDGEFIVEDTVDNLCIFGNQTGDRVTDISSEPCDVYISDIEAKKNRRPATNGNIVLF